MTSDGNNFDDFLENKLTTNFAFLFRPTWGNVTVSSFSLVLISFGGIVSPEIFGERRTLAFLSTTPLLLLFVLVIFMDKVDSTTV